MSTHRMLGASTWDLYVTASITTAAIYVADIEEDYLSYMATNFNLTAFISDLNTACGCSDYSSVSVTYSIPSDDGDDGPNLKLLAILVLLIIPCCGVAGYLYRRQYSHVPKEDHTPGIKMTGKAIQSI